MENFKLTPCDENTIFCDISQLNKAYRIILESKNFDNFEYCLQSIIEKDDDFSIYGIDRHDENFLNCLDENTRYYLKPKLEKFIHAKEKIHDYIEQDATWMSDYQEHEDNIRSIGDCILSELGDFDGHNAIKNLLEDYTHKLTVSDIESELMQNPDFEIKDCMFNGWSNGYSNNDIGVTSWPIDEIEAQISVNQMLNDLSLDITLDKLNLIFLFLDKDFSFARSTPVKSLDSYFEHYINYGGGVSFYFTESDVIKAIEKLGGIKKDD